MTILKRYSKIIITIVLMSAIWSLSFANWKMNPYTGKLDYYESTADFLSSSYTGSTNFTTAGVITTGTISTTQTGTFGGLFASTIIGSVISGGTFTLQSTSHAAKGKIFFGTSAYDEANNRLGIGTAIPAYRLDVIYNEGVNGAAAIRVKNTLATGQATAEFRAENNLGYSARMFKLGSSYGGYKTLTANDIGFYNDSQGGNISILNDTAAGKILFAAGASSTAQMILTSTGNVGIGTTTPTVSSKLTVSGGNLDIIDGGIVSANTATALAFSLSALNTAPTSSVATCTTGMLAWDADYHYVCVGTNSWKRTALTTW